MTDPFQDPKGGEFPPQPNPREIDGRLVAFVVKEYDPLNKFPGEAEVKPQVTVDLFVIDGGPLEYGGKYPINGDPQVLPPYSIETPCVFKGAAYTQTNLVSALKDAVGGGPVLGVIERSTFGRKPWNLAKLAGDNPKRKQAAEFWATVMMGGWVKPVHVPIPGRAAPIPDANPYAPQPAAAAVPDRVIQSVAPPGYEALWGTLTDAQKATVLAAQAQPATTIAAATPAVDAPPY